jgi:hypothetical protein
MCAVKIYRVEDANGQGPYRLESGGNLSRMLGMRHNDSYMHPPMITDFHHDLWEPEMFFGFHTLDLLFEWFDDAWNILSKRELYISEYLCDVSDFHIGKSKRQVVFLKDKCKLNSKIRI